MLDVHEFAILIPDGWSKASDRYLTNMRNTGYIMSVETQVEWEKRFAAELMFPTREGMERDPAIPWSMKAIYQAIEIRSLIRKKVGFFSYARLFEPAMTWALESLSEDRTKNLTDQARFDRLLVGYFFMFGLKRLKERDAAHFDLVNGYEPHWNLVTKELLGRLSGIKKRSGGQETEESPDWAKILRLKIIQNLISIEWNDCRREDRNTEAIKKRFQSFAPVREIVAYDGMDGIGSALAALHEYNRIVPGHMEAPLCELAIASRWEDRERYPAILRRLNGTDGFQARGKKEMKRPRTTKREILEFFSRPDYDSDYDHFRDWCENGYEETMPPPLEGEFASLVPNEMTIAAMKEARDGALPRFRSVNSLFEDLRARD